jgi:ferritin
MVFCCLEFFFEPVVVVRGRGRDRGSPVSPRAVPLLWLWWWWRLVSAVDPDAVSTARRGRLFFCFEERQKEGKREPRARKTKRRERKGGTKKNLTLFLPPRPSSLLLVPRPSSLFPTRPPTHPPTALLSIEYNISYVYHAMYAYFSRDNDALPGFASYFKNESVEERHHAELLMDFQNTRGGRVKFQSILMPEMEFHDAAKGDALYAMELALSLEKLNISKLRALHSVADAANDANMADFIEGELLADQARSVEKVANYVAQLRRVGPGLGVFEFDRKLAA